MKKKQSFREVWKKNQLVFIAIATIGILFFPTGFVHEFGHIVVCVYSGFDYTFFIGDLALNVQCSNTPQDVLWYFAFGGVFGMVASLALFAIPLVRKNKGIFIGVSVTAFDHFLKSIFETFTHSAYLYNPILFWYMSILGICFMFFLVWFFSKRSAKIT